MRSRDDAGYAETGEFERAVHTQRQAIVLAHDRDLPAVIRSLEERIGRYSAGKPLRATESLGSPKAWTRRPDAAPTRASLRPGPGHRAIYGLSSPLRGGTP